MKLDREVLLVTKEPQTVSAVTSALGLNGSWSAEGVFSSLGDVAGPLQQSATSAVLVDLGSAPAEVLAELDALTRRHPQTRFIVLSSVMSLELVLQAMQAGARDFILKQSMRSDLAGMLRRHAPEVTGREPTGIAVSLFSASGGCGTTTLAVNLANELHLMTSEPVLLMDLDLAYGAVGQYFGLRGDYGIADVLARRASIDPQLIMTSAVSQRPGIHVLLSPATISPENPAAADFDALKQAVVAARAAYGFTVVDAPRLAPHVNLALAGASRFNLIVFQLNVKDVRLARSLALGLQAGGVPNDRIVFVANRSSSRHEWITLAETSRFLDQAGIVRISNDYKAAVRALNYGQPLSEAAGRSHMRAEVQGLARQLAAAESRIH